MKDALPRQTDQRPASWVYLNNEYKGRDPKWSGKYPLPHVGDRVVITLNGWEGCQGTVEGFRLDDCGEDGVYVGVCVRVDQRPDWHANENPTRHVVYFVGRETRPAER